MKKDITDLKKLVIEIIENDDKKEYFPEDKERILEKLYQEVEPVVNNIPFVQTNLIRSM